jgi:glycerol dehydrogenase-like iron-containing ADH family enzyme
MELPRHVTIGHDVLENIGEISRKLHFRGPAILVVDKTTKRIAGNRVEELLNVEKYETLQVIIDDADLKNLELVKDEIAKLKAKFILGVGGGRPI